MACAVARHGAVGGAGAVFEGEETAVDLSRGEAAECEVGGEFGGEVVSEEAVAGAVVGGDVAAGDEVVEAVLGLGFAAEEGVSGFG